jgi:hypothetical protein
MSEFTNNEESTTFVDSQKKTCIVGISSKNPYDTSEIINNSTTYTNINYNQFTNLYEYIKNLKLNPEYIPEIQDLNLIYIYDCFKSLDIEIIFRFLCSSDCCNGDNFKNDNQTQIVFDFVKLVCERKCILEFSDHSMASFFNNWDNIKMELPKPIEILPWTQSGNFKMYGNKNDFINSIHPVLKQIGDMSNDENIEITFNNMGGTKVFKIINENVKLISNGIQIERIDINKDIYNEVPVHCEFDYKLGTIVISATHWCNLNSVEMPINIPKLRRYYTESMTQEEVDNFDLELSNAPNEVSIKRIISNSIRALSSGETAAKKSKFDKI